MITTKDIERWMKKDPDENTFALLAVRLGYKSEMAIRGWLKRGNIPRREVSRVVVALASEERKQVVSI